MTTGMEMGIVLDPRIKNAAPAWIGVVGEVVNTKPVWTWEKAKGTVVAKPYWMGAVPDAKSKTCVVLGKSGRWSAADCKADKAGFICEYRPKKKTGCPKTIDKDCHPYFKKEQLEKEAGGCKRHEIKIKKMDTTSRLGKAFAPYTKFATVFGLYVVAEDAADNLKVLHVAHVLAQWIDNNGDGNPDSLVGMALRQRGAYVYFKSVKAAKLTNAK